MSGKYAAQYRIFGPTCAPAAICALIIKFPLRGEALFQHKCYGFFRWLKHEGFGIAESPLLPTALDQYRVAKSQGLGEPNQWQQSIKLAAYH